MAVMMTPKNQPKVSKSRQTNKAQAYFWKTLHEGRYQDIGAADYLLMAAYLQNPNDPQLASHIGFLHIWKITERQRLSDNDPSITNEIILARKYFKTAHTLEPSNPIYQGFLGDSLLSEGTIFHDQRQVVKGYFTLKDAIAKWPEFNYFTAGYPMSTLPIDSPYFKEALAWQWKTLDLCAGKTINRKHPDFSGAMARESHHGKQRACWNSWVAPYNFEGFFMNMGDMLVKSGDWQTAIVIYNNAKLAKNYATWPYREKLEQRIQKAQANVAHYRRKQTAPEHAVMFNSGYGCMACHQSA